MQKTNIPNKFLLPWAQNDVARVEVPVTTTSTTRASQSLGFPPLTMVPPEAGGVPPNGEDFNGGMNQISRAIWWMLQGGAFPYDSTFATSAQIGGYASGACIPRADGLGFWVSTADNNTTNPDATDGTAANWVPAWVYGTAAITATSTDVTIQPVNAAKPTLLISGTLTASVNIILPAWLYKWEIVDNTVRGGNTLTVKTASGSGVVLQTGAQIVRGDGTNIVQLPQSIAQATASTQPVTLGQADDRYARGSVLQAGDIVDVAGNTLPANRLWCPTAPTNVSRTTYAALFAAIGTTWGAGDGSTTFGLPYFPADYAAVHASGNVGTTTAGQVIAHTHGFNGNGAWIDLPGTYVVNGGGSNANLTQSAATASTGGAANLAAGMRVRKSIVFQ
jgi:microcystin-dependent protein